VDEPEQETSHLVRNVGIGAGAITVLLVALIIVPIIPDLMRDKWELYNADRVSARLEEADRLQQSDSLAALKIYDEVLKEAGAHEVTDEQLSKKLASAETSRSALEQKSQLRAEQEASLAAHRKRIAFARAPLADVKTVDTLEPKQLGSGRDFIVRVQVWDDTDRKPIHEKAEIWFRGHGSWWLKPASKSGAAAMNLGRREMDVKFTEDDAVQFYPEGRTGPKISIPLMMTAAMNPEGSQRDTIIINIDDAEIEVIGLPIEAAIGKTTLKFDRMTGESLSHIDPILLTAEQEKALQRQAKSTDPSSEIIGRWLDTSPLLGGKITIFRKDGRFFMEYKYNDGSGDITELVETRSQVGRRFDYKPDRGNDEYYLIDSRGDLQELDRGGPFVTFKKLN